jgi:hypothetical protein
MTEIYYGVRERFSSITTPPQFDTHDSHPKVVYSYPSELLLASYFK